MLRPCFLVVDREHAGAISTRKLILETAKFNVITAYTAREALATMEKFPRVDGAVIDTANHDLAAPDLVKGLKAFNPALRVIAVGHTPCQLADFQLDSFDPKKLLTLLQSLEPESSSQIEQHERTLEG